MGSGMRQEVQMNDQIILHPSILSNTMKRLVSQNLAQCWLCEKCVEK